VAHGAELCLSPSGLAVKKAVGITKLASLMLLCTPVLACGTQLNPLPCEPAGLRQTDGQFIFTPRFRPVPSPRVRARSNRRPKG
jgi:hypothetical protein